jgi:hypothetical protein
MLRQGKGWFMVEETRWRILVCQYLYIFIH